MIPDFVLLQEFTKPLLQRQTYSGFSLEENRLVIFVVNSKSRIEMIAHTTYTVVKDRK